MTRTKLIIVACFVLAFVAGVAVGLALRRHGPHPPPDQGGWLARELDLTPQQQERMKAIWSDMDRDSWRDAGDRRREMQRQRDDAVRALLPEDKLAEFDRINDSWQQQMTQMGEQRRKMFQDAVEKTKQILDERQRTKYDEILAQRESRWRRGPQTAPSTRPATTQPNHPFHGP